MTFDIYEKSLFKKTINDVELIQFINDIVFSHDEKTLSQRGQKIYTLKCSYDIETTNIQEIKKAFCYIQMFAINEFQIIFRYWNEFEFLIQCLNNSLKRKNKNSHSNIIVWVANLGFEFQFFRKHIKVDSVFARTKRNPIKVVCDFIEFHDALLISGQGGLKQLAKTYCKTQKLTGDLDYNVIRNYKTKLSKDEIQYCLNDVVILTEFADYIFKTFKSQNYIPLTQTGIVRKDCKKRFGKNIMKHKEYIKSCYFKENTYKYFMKYLFRGGYVHSNAIFTNKIIEDVKCVDFTSSYPAVMNQCYYPITKFEKVDILTFSELKDKCYILQITFSNLENVNGHSLESTHKVIKYNEKKTLFDNGRIFSTDDEITVLLTEIDLSLYKKFYKWKKYKIQLCLQSERGRLPTQLLENLNNEYFNKCNLKKQGLDDTIEYKISKSRVNSHYGMCVTRLNFTEIEYINEDWKEKETNKNYDELIKSEFLLAQWGIYITAWARYNLLSVVAKMENVIYCDTDSIYYINSNKNKMIIENYNQNILKKNKLLFNSDLFYDLGQFSEDGEYQLFKTLGCKRYVAIDKKGKIKQTISGLKKNTLEKMKQDLNLTDIELLEKFSEEMIIENKYCEKLTSSYYDEDYSELITDSQGNTCKMCEKSGITLIKSDFNISIKELYTEFLQSSILKCIRPENYNVNFKKFVKNI